MYVHSVNTGFALKKLTHKRNSASDKLQVEDTNRFLQKIVHTSK